MPASSASTEDVEGAPLRVARLAHDQRATDLHEIALDRGRELRRHQIARSDASFRRRRHAENLLAAGADDHEIVRTAAASQIGLDIRHHLVLPAAGPNGIAKDHIGFVRQLRRAPERRDLRRQLVHQQPVDHCRAVLECEAAALVGEPVRQQATRRGREAMIGHPLEPRARGAGDVGGEMDGYPRCLRLGALGFGCAVEKKLGGAVGRHHHDAVAFQDAEIGGIAQIIALPGIAVEHHVLDARLRHGGEHASAPLLGQQHAPTPPRSRAPARSRSRAAPLPVKRNQRRCPARSRCDRAEADRPTRRRRRYGR